MKGLQVSSMDGLRRAFGALTLLLAALTATAHTGGVTGYAALQVQDNVVRYTLTLSALPPLLLERHGGDAPAALEAAGKALRERLVLVNAGEPCVAVTMSVSPPTAERVSVGITVDFACPGPVSSLRLRDDSFDVMGPDLHVLGRASRGEETRDFTLAVEAREVEFAFESAAGSSAAHGPSSFVDYLVLGVEHILIGYDHLLFLFALLLAGGSLGVIVRIVTAFTVAHSLTLALTVLDVLRLPSVLVEAVIAASIAWVAAENLWARRPLSRRTWVTAAFGLVHGCGFASVLRDIGLPTAALWPPLLGFNVGVECGQLAVIAVAVPALRWLGSVDARHRLRRGLSALVCVLGAWLLFARLMSG